ncbi:HAMP domain-containing histidine kinase [Paenibacillus sp. SYP-B3998]|uniref:histidine kinase n=1 Tax=Paenibacillus sp. SYP-B3998 TaxID=2678564 RepID=A0A6G3ZS26_9BACL|nr:HAMP domain-containing sensor histidine kinase [Paenibacillus sp. SYP-B3998]NEW04942.1 HAMP domain-containing histidine kinase [Paenibacillus sp. SYP-B3998]
MDIKSRNNYMPYLLVTVLIYASVLAILVITDVVKNRELLKKDAYFQSQAFHHEIELDYNLIRYYHIDNKDYPLYTEQAKIGAERSEAWKVTYEGMERKKKDAYMEKIIEAKRLGKFDEAQYFQEGMNGEFAQIENEITELLATRTKDYLSYKNKEYSDVENSLTSRSRSFHYYIEDQKNSSVYRNMDIEPKDADVKQALYAIELPQTYVKNEILQRINTYFQKNSLKGYFIIPKEARGFSQIHADYMYFNSIRERLFKEIAMLVVNSLLIGGLFLYMKKNYAFRFLLENMPTNRLRQIPLDVRLLITAALCCILVNQFNTISFFKLPIRLSILTSWTILSVILMVLALFLIDGIRLCQCRDQFAKQWESSLYRRISVILTNRRVKKSMLYKAGFVFSVTVLLGVAIPFTIYGMEEQITGLVICGIVYGLLYAITILPFMIRRIRMLHRIMVAAEQIAEGDLSDSSIVERGKGNLAQLALHLNNMKKGFKASMEKEKKSERMKSELVTNVSHDLKTPLTSIINYVDLLKQKDLPPESIAKYIEVLDRKSQRLKVLIDDLFEASKMASGAVDLQVETVNVSALLNQALAEFSDKIESSVLTFRVHVEHAHIVAPLDGRKTWRVFENLISNALKYAMPHTRVHLSLSEDQDKVLFTIKNVSSYEIDFHVDGLLERFKRGDSSRHTEGSGLGLAIAKSIVELQGGQLMIEVDGDLFKATVIFDRNTSAA